MNRGDTLQILEDTAMSGYSKTDQEWNVDEFLNRVTVAFTHETEDGMDVEFDLANVGASMANAIRRVLIAEVPSMAIEKVYLYQNTSVIPDEVLCHRLGLLPIYANPSHFLFPARRDLTDEDREKSNDVEEEPPGDCKENIIFELHVKCKKKKGTQAATAGQTGSEKVLSGSFKWVPIEKQEKIHAENPPRMVHDDIIVAKMRPGQEIEARCHCVKGIGRDHAKFSPVATASYRLLPEIQITRTLRGEDAELLKSSFSKGVIEIDELSGAAFVKNARKDTCSRNVFQHDGIKDAVEMSKNQNYFIFRVESTGAVKGVDLTLTSLRVLHAKLKNLHALVKEKL
ncbi:RNA polymerase rpb3/RpoA insert domain-containing protein [Ditylenchus destructor]|uniref:RNA polymerase rpb3/RpoA insert domain-containing protein n=1 Tax=Ditylenchus destructor TaxID=166010 RepID=A0AAD4RAB7_9BILA|nr:RNA polymerase rpb3/RpoA insert domain-containing protein [Ditylenchus destructor]